MLKASPAPQQALTINLNVADDSAADFVASGNQGNQTVQIPAHTTTKTYEVATVNDSNDEPRGEVTVTVATGTGYTPAQTAASDTVPVSDNDRTTVDTVAARQHRHRERQPATGRPSASRCHAPWSPASRSAPRSASAADASTATSA